MYVTCVFDSRAETSLLGEINCSYCVATVGVAFCSDMKPWIICVEFSMKASRPRELVSAIDDNALLP
jgi:hypothetical protein